MRGERLTLSVALLSIASCHEPSGFLPFAKGETTLVFATERNGTLDVEARASSDLPLKMKLAGGDEVRVTALVYRSSLADLGFSRGKIDDAALDPGSLPLPRADETYQARLHGGSFSGWTMSATLSDALKKFRVRRAIPFNCVQSGGCYLSTTDPATSCTVPCPMPGPPDPTLPPDPPHFAPCPSGWRTLTSSDADALTFCEPWPPGGRPACAPGSAVVPGDASCTEIGGPCPAGDYPPGLGAGTLYVKAGASPGGVGTIAAPFATIGDAASAASAGTVIAVARGMYLESVRLRDKVGLVGACASGTIVASPSPMSPIITLDPQARAMLTGVTLSGGRSGVSIADPGTKISLDGVIISDAASSGIDVASGTVSAHNLLVMRVRGAGALVHGGGTLLLRRAVFSEFVDHAVVAMGGGSVLDGRDLAIVDASSAAGGLAFTSSAAGTLDRVVVERVSTGGVDVQVGAAFTAGDLVVRDLLGDTTFGILANRPQAFHGERILIEGMGAVGLASFGGTVDLTDVAVRGTRSVGVGAADPLGIGFATSGATVRGNRVLISGNSGHSFGISGPLSMVTINDLIVRGGQSLMRDLTGGYGLIVSGGAKVSLERALIEGNRKIGLDVIASNLTATDLVVSDTRPEEAHGDDGRGMVIDGATADITRGRFERNRNLAVYAFSAGTHLVLRHAVIGSTMPSSCGLGFCTYGVADGVNAATGAFVEIQRFVVSKNQNGLRFSPDDATLLLSDGTVSDNTVGLLISGRSPLSAQVDERVLFTSNGQNVMMMSQ